MAEFPEDLSSEIERLWAKVSASGSSFGVTPPMPPPAQDISPGSDVAWEAVSLLKRQHRHETRYWSELLESKERALQAAQERLVALEHELVSLRGRAAGEDQRRLEDSMALEARLSAALSGFEGERADRQRETDALRALLDQTRQRLAAEAARFADERAAWEARDKQYLMDIAELQGLAERRHQEHAAAGEREQKLSQTLREAKNALEKTLAELLQERQIREHSEAERAAALRKVDETQSHFEEFSKLWEEERAQWRELWERERSSWEGQRAEMSSWEESLRRERELWHTELQAKEQQHTQFNEQLGKSLRESAEMSAKMAKLLRAPAPPTPRVPPWAWKAALGVVLAAALGAGAFRYFSRYHFRVEATSPAPAANPTGLAYDGTLLWITQWDGALVAVDPADPRAVARRAQPAVAAPYRPSGLAFGGEYLWSLDAAQGRLIRHRAGDPAQIVSLRPSPGPAPTALAFDGRALWSYDAANRALYRHGSDEASAQSFALEEDVVPTAMAWVGGELWLCDARSRSLLVYEPAEGAVRLRASYPLGYEAVGLAALAGPEGRRVWVLAGPSRERTGYALIKLRY